MVKCAVVCKKCCRVLYCEKLFGFLKKSLREGKNLRIQIVEDDRALREGIVMALKEPETTFVQSGSIRLAKEVFTKEACAKEQIDLVILDVNLPDGSGYDYLKWLRERSEVSVLILTANDMEMDEVLSLNMGADDYMTKPFSLAVLRARIQNLMRRRMAQSRKEYREEDFGFDFDKVSFTKKEEKLVLSPNEQKLLRLLVENKGRLLTREALIDRLWSDGGEFVDENALSVTINRLRSKLESKGEKVTYIQTVYGQGYMWKREEKE